MAFTFNLNGTSTEPKYQQLVDAVVDAIAQNNLHIDDPLPSVNQVCEQEKLSRDTVFKAYSLLKKQGVVQSVPNKGYFVATTTRKVFLLLDTLKAYKEVLYEAFIKSIPDNVLVDVHFHHYNKAVFNKLVEGSLGKYSKFIIMPFEEKGIEKTLKVLPQDKLLLIDWKIASYPHKNIVFQDFGNGLFSSLEQAIPILQNYKKFNFLFPKYTYHPKEAVVYFEKFCQKHQLDYQIITDSKSFDIQPNEAYLSVSDRLLGRFLHQCKEKQLELGVDIGIISYNETPMKQFINKGISVISTDFELLGKKAAEFVTTDQELYYNVPTTLTLRASI